MPFSFVKRGLLLGVSSLIALAAFAAETPVRLTTKDNWNLAAVYVPAQEGRRTVILLHDLGKTKETFASFRAALAKEGIGYLALDLRGYGQSTSGGVASKFAREGVDNQFNKMTRDVDAAVGFLQKKRNFRYGFMRVRGRTGSQCGCQKYDFLAASWVIGPY